MKERKSSSSKKHPAIPKCEDDRNEFKEKPRNLEREIVAFANHKGGNIYIGVDDSGRAKPITPTNRSRSELVQAISNCQPRPTFTIEELDDFTILRIEEGSNKPYRAPDGFYLRVGASSQKLARDEIIKFFISENRLGFDSQIIATVSNLNSTEYLESAEIDRFREQASYLKKLTNKQLLLNLDLIKERDSKYLLTNAAVLLFASRPQKWFRQSRVLLWLMASPTDILDHKVIEGNLQRQLWETLSYIKVNLHTRFQIRGVRRSEVVEFPDEILRELVLNQLIHRDYFEHSADIEIRISPDRIEFSNPAVLPTSIPLDNLMGRSFRRNVLLAEAFQRIGFIERAGTGLLRVKKYLEESYGLPLLLNQEGVHLIITLPRPEYTTGDVLKDKDSESRIQALLAGNEYSSKEISSMLNIPVRTVRQKLKSLLASNLVFQKRKGRRVLYSLRNNSIV